MSQHDDRRSRFERELQEIVERADRPPGRLDTARGAAARARYTWPPRISAKLQRARRSLRGAGGWVVAFALAIAANLTADRSSLITNILVAGSIIALALTIVSGFGGAGGDAARPGSGRTGLPPSGTDWSHRLRDRKSNRRK